MDDPIKSQEIPLPWWEENKGEGGFWAFCEIINVASRIWKACGHCILEDGPHEIFRTDALQDGRHSAKKVTREGFWTILDEF